MQLSTQHKNKKKVKLLNRKIEIENEVTENEIKNWIKVKQAGVELGLTPGWDS